MPVDNCPKYINVSILIKLVQKQPLLGTASARGYFNADIRVNNMHDIQDYTDMFRTPFISPHIFKMEFLSLTGELRKSTKNARRWSNVFCVHTADKNVKMLGGFCPCYVRVGGGITGSCQFSQMSVTVSHTFKSSRRRMQELHTLNTILQTTMSYNDL